MESKVTYLSLGLGIYLIDKFNSTIFQFVFYCHCFNCLSEVRCKTLIRKRCPVEKNPCLKVVSGKCGDIPQGRMRREECKPNVLSHEGE